MALKMLVTVLMLALFSLTACTVVEKGPVVRERPAPVYISDIQVQINDQQKRIDEGIASGRLTPSEANVVQDNLNWIRNRYARMKSDGLLTPKEERKLERMLGENSDMIYKRKHNFRRLY